MHKSKALEIWSIIWRDATRFERGRRHTRRHDATDGPLICIKIVPRKCAHNVPVDTRKNGPAFSRRLEEKNVSGGTLRPRQLLHGAGVAQICVRGKDGAGNDLTRCPGGNPGEGNQ